MHSITPYLRGIATRREGCPAESGRPPDAEEAQALWGAILDGDVPDLEVGALVASLALAGESADELLGLYRAIAARSVRLRPGLGLRAISIPAYGLVPGEATFVSALALFLRGFGVPVIVHGCLESAGERSAAALLRQLGVLPCASIAQAEERLRSEGIALVPAQLLSPSLANALSLRSRLGGPNAVHLAATALDPDEAGAVRVAAVVPGTPTQRLPCFLPATGGDALVFTWPAGETPANVARLPRVARCAQGRESVLFESDAVRQPPLAGPQDAADAAGWVRAVVGRRAPVPIPLVKLAAACIHASGMAPDISQAKAILALQSGRFAA